MPINKKKKPFYKFFLLFFILISAVFFGQTAIYTVASTSSVTASGTAPVGSTQTYSQTYTATASQITKDNSATLTLKGYSGYKITGIVLRMKSNNSSGSGNMTTKVGSTTIYSISTNSFSDVAWYGAYSTAYVDITKTPTVYDIGASEDIVIKINATENSLYIEKYTINYESSGISSVGTGVTKNWSDGTAWVGGIAPTSADNAIIVGTDIITVDNTTVGTRNAGTTTTVNSGATLATNVAYQNNGTTTINGTFQINNNGFGGGANDFKYGTTGTLIFNHNNNSYYGPIDNGHKYWPATNSPFNVTINTNSPVNLGVSRTVAGTFQTAAGVTLSSSAALTLNGTAKINPSGSFNNSPIYGSASTLIYYTSGVFGRAAEWNQSSGTIGTTAGYPNNVQISNNTTLNFPNNSNSVYKANGSLTIDSGSILYQNYSGFNSDLILVGNMSNNGTLGLGGDLTLAGNWTNSGTFSPNDKAVFFNAASGTQTITKTGGETFAYLVHNGAGLLKFLNNVTVTASTGDVLQLLNGTIDLNAKTLDLSGAGGNIKLSGDRILNSTIAGAIFNISGTFPNVKSIYGGTLSIPANVTTVLKNGLDFGSNITTVLGKLQIQTYGYVPTNPPIYGSASVLEYNGISSFDVGNEWNGNSTTAGNGVPQNVNLISSSINFPNFNHGLAGNLNIDSNSTLNLNATSGDLYIAGNWTKAGTFNPNNRAVFFNGSANQTITDDTTFDYLTINNAAGITLANSVINNKTLDFTNGKITLGTNNLTIGNTGSITNFSNSKYIVTNNTGQLKQNVAATSVIFPVGPSTSLYNPISATNSGTSDIYGFRVKQGVADASDINLMIKDSWYASEAVSGGGNLRVSPQWNSADEGTNFSVGNNFIELYSPAITSYPATVTGQTAVLTNSGDNFTNSLSGTEYFSVSTRIIKKYYKSKTTGDWKNASSWDSSTDNITFSASADFPTKDNANSIIIQNAHKITINSSGVSMTETTVQNGGTLEIKTSNSFELSGADEIELTIENGGVFLVNSADTFNTPTGNAHGLIKTGGKLVAGAEMGSLDTVTGTDFANSYLGYNNGLFYFENEAICEWLSGYTVLGSSSPTDSDFFFPYTSAAMPIFRISTTPKFAFGASSTSNIFYAVLEANANFSVQGSASKTFNGGVKGTATVTQNSGSGKLILGNGTNTPTIGGSITLNVLSAGLQLPNGANVPVGATPIIMSSAENNTINRQGGNLTVDGTLDITNMRITNTSAGGVIVNGTLKTANIGGVYGANSAIVSGNFTLNTGSTIEYYATANQSISSAPNYYNITFSGAGIKTTQGAISVNTDGLVKITGTTTVDATSNLASTGSNNTAFTMDGGRLIIRTGNTQPNMSGVYNLTGGVVEFASTSATDIRTSSPPNQYYNVDVSGTNVKSGGKKLIVNNILKLTTATAVLNIPDELDGNNPYVVTAKNGLQVVSGGKFNLGNNANLLQDASAVNSGDIFVDRIAKLPNNGYNYWTAPVSGQPLLGNTFSPGTPDSRIFAYRESNDRFYATGDTTFQTAKGYAIKGGTADDGVNPHRFNFKGAPNNGNLSTSFLNCTGCSPTNKDHGYNLIGNPYPSNLDFDLFWNSNNNSMYSTAYFWTNNTYTANQQGSNYSGANYAIYNGTGGNPAAYQGTSAGPTPTSSIKPGQGFIIQMRTAASLNFDNSMRKPATSVFFNNKNSGEKDRFHLTLTSPSNISNVLLIGYVPGATDNYEGDFDADLLVEGSDSFYSKLGNSKLAIQGRNFPLVDTDVVPLGAVYYETGLYKISLSDSEGVFKTDQNIYLKDKFLNQAVNLSKQDYTFSAVKGADDNRFEIIYQPFNNLGLDENVATDVSVYRSNENFIVKSTGKIIEKLEVFDVSGKLVLSKNKPANQYEIPANNLAKGVYFVKISQENKLTIKKILK